MHYIKKNTVHTMNVFVPDIFNNTIPALKNLVPPSSTSAQQRYQCRSTNSLYLYNAFKKLFTNNLGALV